MMWNGIIHTVKESIWTKYNKYRVVLSIRGEKDMVCWLSEKQMTHLWLAFGDQEYSNKHRRVIGFFDGSRYCYCRTEIGKRPKREFHRPPQRDVSDLWEND